jgi:hypothetical protein
VVEEHKMDLEQGSLLASPQVAECNKAFDRLGEGHHSIPEEHLAEHSSFLQTRKATNIHLEGVSTLCMHSKPATQRLCYEQHNIILILHKIGKKLFKFDVYLNDKILELLNEFGGKIHC